MRISKKAKPEACCKRGTADESCYPRLVLGRDGEQGHIVASNGAVTVKLPCDLDPGDTAGPITLDALRAARMHASKEKAAEGKMHIVCGDPLDVPDAKQQHGRPDLQKGLYAPDTKIPGRGRKGTITLDIDHVHLGKIGDAFGCRRLRLSFVEGNDAIRVEPADESPVWNAEAVLLASKGEPDDDDDDDEKEEAEETAGASAS